jgi:hypothetical protein
MMQANDTAKLLQGSAKREAKKPLTKSRVRTWEAAMRALLLLVAAATLLCTSWSFVLPAATLTARKSFYARPSTQHARPVTVLHALDPATVLVAADTAVSAWSVNSVTADLGAILFQASLAPCEAFVTVTVHVLSTYI